MRDLKTFTKNIDQMLSIRRMFYYSKNLSKILKLETIDEVLFAYKPMQEIVDNVKDTIDIIKILKHVYKFKSKGD